MRNHLHSSCSLFFSQLKKFDVDDDRKEPKPEYEPIGPSYSSGNRGDSHYGDNCNTHQSDILNAGLEYNNRGIDSSKIK